MLHAAPNVSELHESVREEERRTKTSLVLRQVSIFVVQMLPAQKAV
jgi:hypothetical protein